MAVGLFSGIRACVIHSSAQIEKANLAELDWALANMDGQNCRKGMKLSNEVVEVDTKFAGPKEEVCFFFSLWQILSPKL